MAAGFFEFREQVTARRSSGAAAPASRSSSADRVPLTVSQLTSRIDRTIQNQFPESLLVQGEISNFNRNQASGHFYFTMKDPESCIECVMWKSDVARIKFAPKDGMELLASGRLGVYGKRGRYQLYVSTLRPVGQGALELALQQLRSRLGAEGLFAQERKRPLPKYPLVIGLITSREGAALQDMLKVLRKLSWLQILIYPVPVQGEGAAERIAEALSHFNAAARSVAVPDLIILARGGGSLEDLWAFNEEIVARAVFASSIAVVTGIGHEVDTSIADLVADYHAHTPTEAARVVTAHWLEAPGMIATTARRLRRVLSSLVQESRHRLLAIARHEVFRRPLDRINLRRQQLDDRQRAMGYAIRRRFDDSAKSLRELESRFRGWLPSHLRDRRDRLDDLHLRLLRAVDLKLRHDSERLARTSALLSECHPRHRLVLEAQRLDNFAERARRGVNDAIRAAAVRTDLLEARLRALNPSAVLQRGYSITTRKRDGLVLRNSADVRPGDRLLTQLADGQIQSIAGDSAQLPLFE